MVRTSLRRIAVPIVLLIVTIFSAMPAYAGWQPGIHVAEAAVSAKPPCFDTPDAFIGEVMRLINAERVGIGLDALEELETLSDLSSIRACESAVSFSHRRPDERSCCTVFTDAGLSYSKAGENLGYGFKDPADLVNAWMKSKSHSDNILNKKFVFGGIGFHQDEDGVIYCSLLLYTPKIP